MPLNNVLIHRYLQYCLCSLSDTLRSIVRVINRWQIMRNSLKTYYKAMQKEELKFSISNILSDIGRFFNSIAY